MNVLVLTPDGVGSTILQRLLTMTFYLEKINVVNTHELANGGIYIKKNGIISKKFISNAPKKSEDYSQKLSEIIELIKNSHKDTKIISKLSEIHLNVRQDDKESKKKFYNFLNNFYDKKIMCVRKNIFEYALSKSILSEKLTNVYNIDDKKQISKISEIDEELFIHKLKLYVRYVNWANENFQDIEKVYYEDMVMNSDYVIEKITGFKNTFSKNFNMKLSSILRLEYDFLNYLMEKKNKKFSYKKEEMKALFLYKNTSIKLIKNETMVFPLPVKSTTLQDKKKMLKNYDRCLGKFYNFAKNHNWIDQNIATYDFWNKKNL